MWEMASHEMLKQKQLQKECSVEDTHVVSDKQANPLFLSSQALSVVALRDKSDPGVEDIMVVASKAAVPGLSDIRWRTSSNGALNPKPATFIISHACQTRLSMIVFVLEDRK